MPLIATIKTGCYTDSSAFSTQRKLARTLDGVLHAVYDREDNGVARPYHAYSSDGGETWTEEALTSGGYGGGYPAIAVDGNDCLHVVWQGYSSDSPSYTQIQYRKYDGSWGSISNLTSENYGQRNPCIAVDNNNYLHVVWYGKHSGSPSYNQIRYRKYDGSWQDIVNLTSESYTQWYPSIAIDSNNYLHIVWEGTYSGSTYYQIRYIKYTTSWSSVENLTSESYQQYEPNIATDGGDNLHIVWLGMHAGSSYFQIRYRKYTDSWQDIENLTSESYDQYYPSVSVDSNNYLHAVWNGSSANSPNYKQIRHIKYTNSWGSVENLTSAEIDQWYSNAIWAKYPIHGNTPQNGYAFIWVDGTTLKYYASADLAWIKVVSAQGAISPSGAISRFTGKNVQSYLSFAGIITHRTFKSLAGALTSAGALAKMTSKMLSGVLSSAGAISKLPQKVMEGAIYPAGELTRNIYKTVAGAISPFGTVLVTFESIGIELLGNLTSAGALVKQTSKNLAGELTLAGGLGIRLFVSISGTLTSAGAVVKNMSKNVVGLLASVGIITKYSRKLMSGTLTFTGLVQKMTSKIAGGVLSFIGALLRPGRDLKVRLFHRPYRDMATETKPYRDMSVESKDD